MLQVGLIGLGPEWPQRYRPALERLGHRIKVRAVHAAVACRAEQVAAELQCAAVSGMVALLERDDVQAVLVLESDWQGIFPAWTACRLGKPAFLEANLARRLCHTDLQLQAADAGVTIMPELGHRYTPATGRLKELMATRLGRPLVMELEASARAGTTAEVLAAAIDWCSSLTGMPPLSVALPPETDDRASLAAGSVHCEATFRVPSAGGQAARAVITVHTAPPAGEPAAPQGLQRMVVRCLRGEALLEPPDRITWEAAGVRETELLTGDRPDLDVMLDHFTRRVVGGLIPVPTLQDVQRAEILAQSLAPCPSL